LTAVAAGAGCGADRGAPAPTDPSVKQARAAVDRALTATADYRGPAAGPRAQPRGLVVFIAADVTNGGIAGVARGVQQAAGVIGWPMRILEGRTSAAARRAALRTAIALRPGGIILGGFDAAEQRAELRRARALHIAVVGWHAGARPGPDPRNDLFVNVTTDPTAVARLAARYVIADSGGTAGAVIFTDSEYAIAVHKAREMASELRSCRRCSVLATVDTPHRLGRATDAVARHAARAALRRPLAVSPRHQRRVHRRGPCRPRRLGRRADDPPFGVAAGDGDARSSPGSAPATTRGPRSPSRCTCRAGSSSTSSTALARARRRPATSHRRD
jgi:ribose transport system substrate-binding protein